MIYRSPFEQSMGLPVTALDQVNTGGERKFMGGLQGYVHYQVLAPHVSIIQYKAPGSLNTPLLKAASKHDNQAFL